MRIVFLAPFALHPKGTVSARALPLARALQARGHSVTLIIPPWDNPGDSGKRLHLGGVELINVTLPPRWPLLWYLIVTWHLLRKALAQQPEVVHVFKPKGFSGLAAMALWALKRVGLARARLVVDSDDWEGAGGWNERANYTLWQRALFAFQERWTLSHADAITLASRALLSLMPSIGVSPERLVYLPNGCSESGESEAVPKVKTAHDATILLYTRFVEFHVGRITRLLRLVLARVPEARLVVVGQGFWGEEKELARLAEQEGLSQHIRMVGWVARERLQDYFRAAQVAIYPYDDTLLNRTKCSVKLIELLQAGLAVVADRVGQNEEYIVHGESGILVPPGDDEGFAREVVRLLKDESLRCRLGQRAREMIEERFAWSLLVERAEEAYRP